MNKQITTAVFALVGGMLFWVVWTIGGCASVKPVDPNPQITNVEATNKTVAEDVGTRANKIDASASGIASKTPADHVAIFGPFLTDLHTQASGLRVDQGLLDATQAQLQQTTDEVKQLQGDNQTLTDLVVKQKADAKSSVQRLMALTIVLAVLGIGVSAALVYMGNLAVAIPLAVGSLGTLITAIIVSQYAVWLAIGGGVILLGGIVYMIYRFAIHKTALTQVVQTAEAAKMGVPANGRLFIFGNGPLKGQSDFIQSNTTRNLVKQIRSKITTAPAIAPVPIIAPA